MTKQGFDKEKVRSPELGERSLTLPELAELVRPPQSRPPMWVWILVFVIAVVTLLVIMIRSGARTMGMGGLFILPIMLMSVFMMMRNRGGGQNEKARPAALAASRVDYARTLDELREDVHEGARAQAREIAYHHPNPSEGALLTLVGTARMWERSPNDRNFGHVRIGVGVTRLRTKILPPQKVPPPEFRETATAIAARDFLLTQNVVHDVARPLHLFDQMGWSFFTAEDDQRPIVQGLLRAMVCQLCAFHGPDVVRLAIISDDEAAWQGAKWLPHVGDPVLVDASGPVRMIYSDVSEFMDRHGTALQSKGPWSARMEGMPPPDDHMVVVVDLPGANCAPLLGVLKSGDLGEPVDAMGFAGLCVLEATGDTFSALATSATAFVLDDQASLLRAEEVL